MVLDHLSIAFRSFRVAAGPVVIPAGVGNAVFDFTCDNRKKTRDVKTHNPKLAFSNEQVGFNHRYPL